MPRKPSLAAARLRALPENEPLAAQFLTAPPEGQVLQIPLHSIQWGYEESVKGERGKPLSGQYGHLPRKGLGAPEALAELNASIRAAGRCFEPILVVSAREYVCEVPDCGQVFTSSEDRCLVHRGRRVIPGYVGVAGSRRWACYHQLAQEEPQGNWGTIPAMDLGLDLADHEQAARLAMVALMENVSRTDLTSIELGEHIVRLVDDFGLAQQDIAEALGWQLSKVSKLHSVSRIDPRARETLRAMDAPLEVVGMTARTKEPEEQRRFASAVKRVSSRTERGGVVDAAKDLYRQHKQSTHVGQRLTFTQRREVRLEPGVIVTVVKREGPSAYMDTEETLAYLRSAIAAVEGGAA